jgi:hypothetical protein
VSGLSAHDRAELIALLPHLELPEAGSEVDASIVSFIRDHYHEMLDEAGAIPGVDQARAGVIRMLRRGLFGHDAGPAIAAAREALLVYPVQIAEDTPAILVGRHPAWVGLCAVELDEGRIDEAVALAAAGFRALPSRLPAGRGEILWAMAEEAEGAEWNERARSLLEAAVREEFEDRENAWRVRLVLAGRYMADDEGDLAVPLLDEVADESEAEEATRVQALWMLGQLRRENDDEPAARAALQRAFDLAESIGDDDVAERIRGAMDDADAPEDED